jgi:hypothetical protein
MYSRYWAVIRVIEILWMSTSSAPRIAKWDSATDEWELYHVSEDFSQAQDLAKEMPDKLEELKKDYLALAGENKDFPIGAGNWLRLHPEDRIKTPYTQWNFNANTRRMPEFAAPGVGRQSNTITINLDVPAAASGVLYALGGAGGGVTLYMDKGHLVYLYNMMIIEHYTARTTSPLAPGKHKIEVLTEIAGPAKGGSVKLLIDGN